MYYVYILYSSKDQKLYTGFCDNLANRVKKHKNGFVKATKYRRPVKLIYYECYLNELDAKRREKFLKSGSGRRYLNKQLNNHLQAL
jgi:putative endonuclease